MFKYIVYKYNKQVLMPDKLFILYIAKYSLKYCHRQTVPFYITHPSLAHVMLYINKKIIILLIHIKNTLFDCITLFLYQHHLTRLKTMLQIGALGFCGLYSGGRAGVARCRRVCFFFIWAFVIIFIFLVRTTIIRIGIISTFIICTWKN